MTKLFSAIISKFSTYNKSTLCGLVSSCERIFKVKKRTFVVLAVVLFIGFVFYLLPVPKFDRPVSTLLFDRHGELLGASIASDEQWRFPEIESLPEKYIIAATVYEDSRFFYHPGVDVLALARAVRDNIRFGTIVSGASTITMQVVRMSRPDKPRTLLEKLIEMILACRLEFSTSKEDILKLYASHAPYGGNVVGLEAAAWRYFGRSPLNLSWAETATLAVLPNSPALIHPGRQRHLLRQKRDRLLARLYKKSVIDSLTLSLSLQEPLPDKPNPLPMLAPHLLQRFTQESTQSLTRVKLTLDGALQKRVCDIVKVHHRHLALNDINNAAALVLDIAGSEVLAYVGNVEGDGSFAHGEYVDIITAPRSTGSILKPLLYAGMLESGEILPMALVPDIPTHFGGFAPENYTRTYEGAVPAYMALARSLNVPAVRLLNNYGVHRFYALLESLGMTTLFRPAQDYGLSLILGGAEGTLWELTTIYAAVAQRLLPDSQKQNSTFHASLFLDSPPERKNSLEPILSPAACWLTVQALLEVARPEEDMAWREFQSSQKIAWKTGTSYGFRDGWAIGLTPRYAVGVWVGNADGEGRPGLTGISSAAPILFDIFNCLESASWFEPPVARLYDITVCAHSGYRAGPFCAATKTCQVPEAGLAFSVCPYCHVVHCDSTDTWRVHSDCESVADIKSIPWFTLPPAMEWFYRKKHSDYKPLPPFRDDCYMALNMISGSSMNLLQHQEDRSVYVPVELDGSSGRIVFEATHRDPNSTIFWHLDEEYLTATQNIHQLSLSPPPGRHLLTLVDETGEIVQHSFNVLEK
ncbi:penicillin-binding protein 1C [candidate division KSB1 bacterium]|nr:penicillin-binding protein 1C [candidate division KSB1 bacterium]